MRKGKFGGDNYDKPSRSKQAIVPSSHVFVLTIEQIQPLVFFVALFKYHQRPDIDDTPSPFRFSSSPTKRIWSWPRHSDVFANSVAFEMPIAMVHKNRLRYRKFEDFPKVNALPIIINPSTPTAATFRQVKPLQMRHKEKDANMNHIVGKDRLDRTKGDRRGIRFVRVSDRIFKVSLNEPITG